MNVLDLFSGIGGFSLGLERAGMRTVAFCEIDPFCRRVLAKHWPGVPCYDDIRTLTAERLAADGISVDAICGGFPCQDISVAGKGAGLAGERSVLWSEYARLIGELRPRYVIVENVSGLLSRGLDVVLGELAALGYNAEWHCIPASALGAPHRRDRIWIIAYATGEQSRRSEFDWLPANAGAGSSGDVPDAIGDRLQKRTDVGGVSSEAQRRQQSGREADRISPSEESSDTERGQFALGRPAGRVRWINKSISGDRDWPITSEPVLGRGADGIPDRIHRLKSLGNSVVPQIPEIIGRAIMRANA